MFCTPLWWPFVLPPFLPYPLLIQFGFYGFHSYVYCWYTFFIFVYWLYVFIYFCLATINIFSWRSLKARVTCWAQSLVEIFIVCTLSSHILGPIFILDWRPVCWVLYIFVWLCTVETLLNIYASRLFCGFLINGIFYVFSINNNKNLFVNYFLLSCLKSPKSLPIFSIYYY